MKRFLVEYNTFRSHLLEIRDYLVSMNQSPQAQRIQKLITPSNTDASLQNYLLGLQKSRTSQIVNSAIIISLYGCYENYVFNLLKIFLDLITESNKNYYQLPKALQTKYREVIGTYLSNPQRFKNRDFQYETEIEKYNNMLHSKFQNSVNPVFALSHSGNLHMDEVFGLMKNLGIEDPRTKLFDEPIFKHFHISNGMMESEYSIKRARETTDLCSPIELLIQQRNTVAHNWDNPDRLALEEIENNIIPFVDLTFDCLCRICIRESFGLSKAERIVLRKKTPIKVYNKKIICFNNQNNPISVGNYILLSTYKDPEKIKVLKILNIEVNNVRKKIITSSQAIDIGVETDGTIKDSDRIRAIVNDL